MTIEVINGNNIRTCNCGKNLFVNDICILCEKVSRELMICTNHCRHSDFCKRMGNYTESEICIVSYSTVQTWDKIDKLHRELSLQKFEDENHI